MTQEYVRTTAGETEGERWYVVSKSISGMTLKKHRGDQFERVDKEGFPEDTEFTPA